MYSKRGARLRIVDGYKFRLHKVLAHDVERWVCTHKSCTSYMKLSSGVNIESRCEHNHEPDSARMLMRQKVANACKRRATEDIFDAPSKVMRREMTPEALLLLTESDRDQIRKSIHTARAAVHPPLPKTLPDLHETLADMTVVTKLDEPFILVNDDVANIVMFSTERNLNFCATCDTLLMDGTFYACPTLFAQLFIVHGKKKYTHVPLAFFLLPGKEMTTYQRALQKLKVFLPPTYTPRTVYLDFEDSIHTAVRNVWHTTQVQGCRFHLGQSWFRKLQKLGLVKTYRSASAAGSYLRSFFGLSFVEPTKIEEFFVDDFTQYEPPNDERIHEFSTYVYNTYVSPTARYPPHVWAQYTSRVDRTTNAYEAMHARLNGMLYNGHPNIFVLMDALLDIQERAYAKMLSTETTKQRKGSKEKEAFIREVMNEYEGGGIDTREFVKKLSRKYLV